MEQLVYISTSRSLKIDEAEIVTILEKSRSNNRRDGLTGLLAVGGRRFLQVLEGPAEILDRTYARIKTDPRHFALVQLSRQPIAQRSFAGWDMGFESIEESLTAAITRLTEAVNDPALKAQLESFAEIHDQAA